MAQLVARTRADGGTTWQVKWRQGGTRDGTWQSESFTAEARAETFRLDVEHAGHQWPAGWVKSAGYVAEPAPPSAPEPTFANVATAYFTQQERRVKRGKLTLHTRLFADPETAFHTIPGTQTATQFVDNNTAYAAKFSQASGKRVVIVFPYVGACDGALTSSGWAHTPVSGDPTQRDAIPRQVTASASEMTDELQALVASSPDASKFALVVRLDPEFVVLGVGAAVPAVEVTTARAKGAHVYVSPTGDGDGVVLEPGQPLPQAITADYTATGAAKAAATMTDENLRSGRICTMMQALAAADIPFVDVIADGTYNGGKNVQDFWTIGIGTVPDATTINHGLPHYATHAAALAAAQKLAAQHGAQIVDAG